MKRELPLIALAIFVLFGTLGASCTKHDSVSIDPGIEIGRRKIVEQKIFSEAESKTVALAASESVVRQALTEKEVAELVGMVSQDMSLSSERSLQRVDTVAAALAGSKSFSDASKDVVNNFAKTIITSPLGSSNSSLVGSAISIFRNTQNKDALPLVRPYLNSKDAATRHGASETIKVLGGT